MVAGFAVGAGALLAASSAYACTTWVGKFVVTGSGGSPGAGGTVTGWGAGVSGQMMECKTAPGAGWQGVAKVHAGGNGHTSSSVIVSTAPLTSPSDPCGTPLPGVGVPNKFTPGTYNINFLNTGFGEFAGTEPAREYKADCMTGNPDDPTGPHRSTFEIGEVTVDSNGFLAPTTVGPINKTTNHPQGQAEIADLPGTESAICISGPATAGNPLKARATGEAALGMQNPITVI